jgi:hypothetical protein
MIANGADVHKRQCRLAEFREGKTKVLPPMDNTREGWLEFLSELPPEAEIALGVSTSGYFAMSVLEEAGGSVPTGCTPPESTRCASRSTTG